MITTNTGRRREVFLKMVPLQIHGEIGRYVDTRACGKLNLSGESAEVNIKTINDKKHAFIELVDFDVS